MPTGSSQWAGDGSQQVEARRWKMQASRRQPACESGHARGGRQQAGGRWMPAGDSQQAGERTDKLDRYGSQQATASRREKEASRWKPAGDSQHTRMDMLEVEANRQQPVGGSRKPAGESQQVEDGCRQATSSRREREQPSATPALWNLFFGAMYLCGYVALWLCGFVASVNG